VKIENLLFFLSISIRKAKEKRISEGIEPEEDHLPTDELNNETNISETNSAGDTTSLNPFEDYIEDESASEPTLSLGHMPQILSASKEVLVSDGQLINSPDIRRLQQQTDYTTGTSDHCATPSEISEPCDDVEDPYFTRTQTGQMRRSTTASKKRNSNYSIRSKMSTLLGNKNHSILNQRLSTGSQVECLIDLYSPWGITARQAKAAFLIEGENLVRAADRIQNLIQKCIQSSKNSK
jgi:hypothetical protein